MEINPPDYSKAIFRFLPTLLEETLGLSIPYSFEGKERSLFDSSPISITVVIDSLCPSLASRLPFIKDIWESSGRVLSSVAPSITASALGAIYLGIPPEESGIIAQKFYVENIGNFIDALRGYALDRRERDSLARAGVKLSAFLWDKGVISKLGVKAVIVQPEQAMGGLQHFLEGYEHVSYFSLADAAFMTLEAVKRMKAKGEKGVIFVYLYHLDAGLHSYGRDSEFIEEQMKDVAHFLSLLSSSGCPVYIISDHGQVKVELYEIPKERYEELKKRNIEVAFSGRFAFVYGDVEPEEIEAVFDEKVKTFRIEECIEMGFWPILKENESALKRFLKRAGNIVLISEDGYSVSFKKEGEESLERKIRGPIKANHGGLMKEEMSAVLMRVA